MTRRNGRRLLLNGREVLGVLVGLLDAVDHGDGGENREDPQDRSHHIQEDVPTLAMNC